MKAANFISIIHFKKHMSIIILIDYLSKILIIVMEK